MRVDSKIGPQNRYRASTILVLFILVILVPVLHAGCFLFPDEEKMLDPPVLLEPVAQVFETTTARTGTLEQAVRGPATFVPRIEEDQYFSYAGGRVQSILVDLGDTVKRGELLATLYTGDLEKRIEIQRIALNKAQLKLEKTRIMRQWQINIDMAELDVQAEEVRLEMLEAERQASRLYASIGGEVVFLNSKFAPGAYINAFNTLARIADPTRLELRYTGHRVYDFTVGAPVTVIVRQEGEEQPLTLAGVVVESPASVSADATEEERRTAVIRVRELPAFVDRGDVAQVKLVLDRREDVVIIPRDALREYLGRRYVYVSDGTTRTERTVETGLETATEVEIVNGLEAGESIVLQ